MGRLLQFQLPLKCLVREYVLIILHVRVAAAAVCLLFELNLSMSNLLRLSDLVSLWYLFLLFIKVYQLHRLNIKILTNRLFLESSDLMRTLGTVFVFWFEVIFKVINKIIFMIARFIKLISGWFVLLGIINSNFLTFQLIFSLVLLLSEVNYIEMIHLLIQLLFVYLEFILFILVVIFIILMV